MHVGVKEAVIEHLREENLHAGFGQFFEVDALGAQAVDVCHRGSVDALHHQQVDARKLPVHLRHIEQW